MFKDFGRRLQRDISRLVDTVRVLFALSMVDVFIDFFL